MLQPLTLVPNKNVGAPSFAAFESVPARLTMAAKGGLTNPPTLHFWGLPKFPAQRIGQIRFKTARTHGVEQAFMPGIYACDTAITKMGFSP